MIRADLLPLPPERSAGGIAVEVPNEASLLLRSAVERGYVAASDSDAALRRLGTLPPDEATGEWLVAHEVLSERQVAELRAELHTIAGPSKEDPGQELPAVRDFHAARGVPRT